MNTPFMTEELFGKALEAGLDALEAYLSTSAAFEVRVGNGKVEHFTLAENRGLSLRGERSGSMGYAYTERLQDLDPAALMAAVSENLEASESPDREEIHGASGVCRKASLENPALAAVPEENKIALALAMEQAALSADPRIEAVDYCLYGESRDGRLIKNTKGLELSEERNMAFAYLSVVAREGGVSKSASAYKISRHFEDFKARELADEAVRKALEQLDAAPLASGECPVILSGETAASLLMAFSPVFSAENVQRNLSLLKGRIGDRIGSEDLTVLDDPFLENRAGSRNFDDEGTCTIRKEVVAEGVLKTFLHNRKTAGRDGVSSTGNAFKASYKSPVSVAPTNFFIKPGTCPLDKAMETMGRGLYVTDLQGLHAGVDTISGDFSLSARGFWVEDGRSVRPVHQITIAGNFFEMLQTIEAICDTLTFIMPGQGHVGSPALLIRTLSISGE